MAGLVDHEAVLLDLRGRLSERTSWGTPQLHTLLIELEQLHRIDQSADMRTLARFGAHIQDRVLELLPSPSATGDPLASDDPTGTLAAMDDGAAIRSSHQTEASCPTPRTPNFQRSAPATP